MSSDLLLTLRDRGMEITLNETRSRTFEVNYAFNRLKGIRDTESLTQVAQVIKDGRLGISTTSKAGTTSDLVARAEMLSQFGAPVQYSLPEPTEPRHPSIYHEEVVNFGLDQMLELGEDISKFLASLHRDVNGEVTLRKTIAANSIANTKGLDSSWPETGFDLGISLNFVEGKNLVGIFAGHTSTRLDFNLEALKAEISEAFELGRKNVNISLGSYDVLFTPYGFTSLLAPLEACLDARAVIREISPFGGRLGEEILSPKFTLVNDGVLDNGPRSALHDAQGVKREEGYPTLYGK